MTRKLLKLWIGILAAVMALLGAWWWSQLARGQGVAEAANTPSTPGAPQSGRVACTGLYVKLPPHPSAKLQSAKFASPAQAAPGEPIKVLAYTNGPVEDCAVMLYLSAYEPGAPADEVEPVGLRQLALHDDGAEGDAKAGDGEWYGALAYDAERDLTLRGRVTIQFTDYAAQSVALPGEVALVVPEDGEDPEAGNTDTASAPDTDTGNTGGA